MRIDVVASEPHYLRHMLPIWGALPPNLKGTVHPLYPPGEAQRPRPGHLAMVAGWQDVRPLRGLCDMVYVEHGSGQTYVGKEYEPSYSGSRGQRHTGVIGYISPSQEVADRWMKPAVAVGCPKMDYWINNPRHINRDVPTACFVWHWPSTLVPEARSAWDFYAPNFAEIRDRFTDQGFLVASHGHPKWRGKIETAVAQNNVEVFESENDVFNKADILLVDNSSLAFEFMLLGKAVIFLNAPWYRKDVQHGGRFWDWTEGHPMVDSPEQLMTINLWDYVVPSTSHFAAIERTASTVYAIRDGTSSQYAAAWLTDLVGVV